MLFKHWLDLGRDRYPAALVFGCVCFVLSQPLYSRLAAPSDTWPVRQAWQSRPRLLAAPAPGRSATLFVLLDELNGSRMQSFADDLKGLGLHVQSQLLVPVAANTSQVIPAMWTGVSFEDARPCSFHAICSDSHVLDFARMHASRDDVDVVGFYHPYCAMQGLRFCRRLSGPDVILDGRRWLCALDRGLSGRRSAGCQALNYLGWADFRRSIEEAVWAAPTWQRGGFFYVHLPLPHPPGNAAATSLTTEYQQNVDYAHDLVRRMGRRLLAGHFDAIRLVIYSDHPLRLSLWCNSGTYPRERCLSTPSRATRKSSAWPTATRPERGVKPARA